MIVISRKWKKITYSILTALGIGMLTSCYGMPVTSNYSCISGKVTGVEDNPVEGIKVTLNYNGIEDSTNTDKNGNYYFEIIIDENSENHAKLTFEDIDGDINGNYSGKTEEIILNQFGDCEKNVKLEELKA